MDVQTRMQATELISTLEIKYAELINEEVASIEHQTTGGTQAEKKAKMKAWRTKREGELRTKVDLVYEALMGGGGGGSSAMAAASKILGT